MIKAVYWDIGGVLVRTLDRAPRTRLAERYGITYAELEEIVFGGETGRAAQRGEIQTAELWSMACRRLGAPVEEKEALQAEFFGGDALDKELVDYIRRLRPRYRTGIISNAMDEVRALLEAKWGIADAFDALTLSAEAGVMKPDPRIYQQALQALGVAPHEALFVDDFMRNIEGARALGMMGIHFRSPEQALAQLEVLLQQST